MGFLEAFDKYTPSKFSDVGGYTLYLKDYTTRIFKTSKTKANEALKFSTFSAASYRCGTMVTFEKLMSNIENTEKPEKYRIYS